MLHSPQVYGHIQSVSSSFNCKIDREDLLRNIIKDCICSDAEIKANFNLQFLAIMIIC